VTDRVENLIDAVVKTAPSWVTAEIVRETVDLFEPRYGRELTPDEVAGKEFSPARVG